MFPDDEGMQTLAAHIESWELYQAEEAEKGMARDMNANTMESFLREHGVPMLEQRTPVGNRGSRREHPAGTALAHVSTGWSTG